MLWSIKCRVYCHVMVYKMYSLFSCYVLTNEQFINNNNIHLKSPISNVHRDTSSDDYITITYIHNN